MTITLGGLLSLVVGCSPAYNLAYTPKSTQVTKANKVAILGVYDRRDEIVEKKEDASWLGHLRAVNGIPYDIHTEDGRPFDITLRDIIAAQLTEAGYACLNTTMAPSPPPDISDAIEAAGADKGIFITINEYRSNTYRATDIEYDFVIDVCGADGRKRASLSLAQPQKEMPSPFGKSKDMEERIAGYLHHLMQTKVIQNRQIIDALDD